MAVDWSECPYCRAQRTAPEVGQVEPPPAGVTSGLRGQAATMAATLVRGREVSARPVAGVVFTILYEPDTGQYRIADESGTGGTFLNGTPIDSKGVELPDEAQIRAGNAVFIFKKVHPPAPAAESAAMQEQPVPAKIRDGASSEATGKKAT